MIPLASPLNKCLKRASHWHKFCSRKAPQYGVPSRAILAARSLSRRLGDAQFAPCRAICHAKDTNCSRNTWHPMSISSWQVVTPAKNSSKNLWTFQNFRDGTARTNSPDPHRHGSNPHAHCHDLPSSHACVPWRKRLSRQCEACFRMF